MLLWIVQNDIHSWLTCTSFYDNHSIENQQTELFTQQWDKFYETMFKLSYTIRSEVYICNTYYVYQLDVPTVVGRFRSSTFFDLNCSGNRYTLIAQLVSISKRSYSYRSVYTVELLQVQLLCRKTFFFHLFRFPRFLLWIFDPIPFSTRMSLLQN